jgi:hypothetical protein
MTGLALQFYNQAMSVWTLGLNHTTAPLDLRGRFAYALDQIEPTLRSLRDSVVRPPEATLLSTCNRTEIYCAGGNGDMEHTLAWLAHGLSFAEGWVGYGAKIHEAEFKRLARVGPPLELEAKVTRHRPGRERHVLRYEFDFRQEGEVVYHGDQTAVFQRVSSC